MNKITILCLSLLSAQALQADVKLMMDVCMGDHCMKGEFVLDANNPVAELSDPAVPNVVVQVQEVEATEPVEKQADQAETTELEVVIQNDGVTTTHMVQCQMGCAMQCGNDMVMVTMMVQR